MELRFVTMIVKTSGDAWRYEEIDYVSLGLRAKGVTRLVCHHARFPAVVVVMGSEIADTIVGILAGTGIAYRIEILDNEIEGSARAMVREICDPVLGRPWN